MTGPHKAGPGVCSYTLPSTAFSFSEQDTTSTYRAMLFSDVVVGDSLNMAAGDEMPTEVSHGI